MFEKVVADVVEKEKNNETIGNYNPEAVDDPKRNPFHPDALTKEQIERYGMCHEMAKKFAKCNEAVVYTTTNGKHSIAVKDNKVYDHVLGYNLDIELEEYLDKVPYAFEKKSSIG